MNSKFPLLKLPLLGFEAVVISLEICEIIHLSFTSKRLRQKVKALRLKMNRFVFFVTSKRIAIIFNSGSPNERGGWRIKNIEFPRRKPVTASIGGIKIKTYIKDNWLSSFAVENTQESAKVQMDHLKELFRFPLPLVYVYSDDIPASSHPLLAGINECYNLSILGEKELDQELMNEIFQSCSVKNSIFMHVPVNYKFKHDLLQWSLPKAVYIKKASHWITTDFLFRSNCSHMMFLFCKFKTVDFLQFFERWLNSDDTNFEFLHLHWKNGVPPSFNLDRLGVELMEFDSTRRGRNFVYIEKFALDVSTGKDFIRKDGVLGTIMVSMYSVVFCVFHEKFPNLNGAKVVEL